MSARTRRGPRSRNYLDWLIGVGRQMDAARLCVRALSDMRDIESFDLLKADAALAAWEAALLDEPPPAPSNAPREPNLESTSEGRDVTAPEGSPPPAPSGASSDDRDRIAVCFKRILGHTPQALISELTAMVREARAEGYKAGLERAARIADSTHPTGYGIAAAVAVSHAIRAAATAEKP